MEPRIQYATTSDGVSVAFWTLGEGKPQVHVQCPPFSHIQLEWQWPEVRRFYERLAQTGKLVRYDGRGSGLSDRDVSDFTLERQILDLEAVVDRLGLARFALLGFIDGGPVTIMYAARHPERVSHLLLWGAYPQGASVRELPEVLGLVALLQRAIASEGSAQQRDWRLFTETLVHTTFGFARSEEARRSAEFMSRSTTPQAVHAIWDVVFGMDVTAPLPQIRCPTLVMHPAQIPWIPAEQARLLAARIADARLAVMEGATGAAWWDSEVLEAIIEFLNEDAPELERVKTGDFPSGTVAILFADIADSTALTERLGDTAFRAKARELDERLRTLIRDGGGTPVEGRLVGDGLMAVFTSARQSIAAALRCGEAGSHTGLPLHLGLHAGDVIGEEGNVYGGAVNIASRISGLSAPGEVLVSDTVRSLARTSAGVRFEDRGPHELKGVGEPLRVFAVQES
jgi:class 3 adenylate cyclase/pimeloyl-ACP methyl ester carboxylesterase